MAPVAIAPDMQGRGFGKRMIGMLTEWARLTQSPVVVLGAPEFYGKAGFSSVAAAKLTSQYPTAFLAAAGLSGVPSQALVYPKAFNDV